MSLPKQVNQLAGFHGLAQPSSYCCAKCENHATEIVRYNGIYYAVCDIHYGVYKCVVNSYRAITCTVSSCVDDPIIDMTIGEQLRKPSKRSCWCCFLNSKQITPTTEIDHFGLIIPSCIDCKEEYATVYAYCVGIEKQPWDIFISKAYEESMKDQHVE